MSRKVFNMQGGRHSAAALSAFLSAAFDGDVAAGLNVEPTGTTGLKVLVKPGTGQIKTGQNFSRLIQIDADEEVTIAAASPSNERHDLVVAYIDSKVTPTTAVIDNTNGVLKLASVAGTPSAMPTDPTTATIQSKIGAGNPYIILARVTIPQMASSLTKSNITDLRSRVLIGDGSQVGNDIVLPRSLAPDFRDYSTDEKNTGKKWIDGRPIFRKTVRGTVNMTGGYNTSSLPHGIQGLSNSWELICYYGGMRLSGNLNNNPVKQAFPYIEGAHQSGITSIDQTNITISGSYPWGNSEVSVTLEYIK